MNKFLSADTSPLGTVPVPSAISKFGTEPGLAIGKFINFALQFLIVIAGIYALINLVIAGYSFMAAGEDPKKVAGAWAKIWQTLLGLAVAAGAFVLAAIFGKLIFDNPTFILNPTIPTI